MPTRLSLQQKVNPPKEEEAVQTPVIFLHQTQDCLSQCARVQRRTSVKQTCDYQRVLQCWMVTLPLASQAKQSTAPTWLQLLRCSNPNKFHSWLMLLHATAVTTAVATTAAFTTASPVMFACGYLRCCLYCFHCFCSFCCLHHCDCHYNYYYLHYLHCCYYCHRGDGGKDMVGDVLLEYACDDGIWCLLLLWCFVLLSLFVILRTYIAIQAVFAFFVAYIG